MLPPGRLTSSSIAPMKVTAVSTCPITSVSTVGQPLGQTQDGTSPIKSLTTITAADGSGWPLLGESVAVRQLRSRIRRVAPYFRIASIRGEAGTGKQAVARAIHALSPSREGPFIFADAGLLAESVEHLARILTSAHGGTLYLTRVGELSLAQQSALLQSFQANERHRGIWPYPATGGLEARSVQAANSSCMRILAASDHDLRQLVATGKFRQDLYARLAGLEIFVPPLRQRAADIPILGERLLGRIAKRAGRSPKLLAESAMLWLQEYLWPNNLVELERVIAKAAAFAESETIETDHLIAFVETGLSDTTDTSTLRVERLHDVIQRHVVDVLMRCGGNKVRAAGSLGISRSTLYRMLGAKEAPGILLPE
jgi:DNA-binding NtrC family response regulator